MSGHSKWSSIKHKKGAADKKRGQLFSKLSRALIVAAREGGPDPAANLALANAIEKARSGGGPTLIESVTLRMEGHAVHDDAFYVPKEMFEEWAKRDPIERFRSWLRDNAGLTDAEEEEIGASVKKLLVDAINRADESPLPDPATLTDGVFATPEDLDTPHHK